MAAKKKKASKLKSYEVLVKAYASVVVVDARDEAHATELALEELRLGSLELDEAKVERVLETAEDLEQAKRHAQAVSEP